MIRTKYDQTTGHKNTIPGTVLKNQLKKSFTRFRPICSPSFNTNSIPAGPSIIGGALKTALIPLVAHCQDGVEKAQREPWRFQGFCFKHRFLPWEVQSPF